MQCTVLKDSFSVCRLKFGEEAKLPLGETYCFFSKTDEELSLICETKNVPELAEMREDGYKGFRFDGILNFSLIGVLAHCTDILAKAKIPVLAVSTYNTDYVFIKEEQFSKAVESLSAKGYVLKP